MVSNVSNSGDGNDDIVNAKVRLGESQEVVMAVQCKKTLSQGSPTTIQPTRNGQTVFPGYSSGSYISG